MNKIITPLAFATLAMLSSISHAGIPGRFCVQVTKTDPPYIGTVYNMNMEVDKLGRNVSSIIGTTCYLSRINGKDHCMALQGDITLDTDGSIKLSTYSNEQVVGGNTIHYMNQGAMYNLDPNTMKGQGVAQIQSTDGTNVTYSTSTYTAEIVGCPPPTKEIISESKQLRRFLRNASKK